MPELRSRSASYALKAIKHAGAPELAFSPVPAVKVQAIGEAQNCISVFPRRFEPLRLDAHVK